MPWQVHLTRLTARFHERAAALLILAAVAGLYGVALITDADETSPSTVLVRWFLPLGVWGWAWVAVAAVAVVQGIARSNVGAAAYGLITGMYLTWGLALLAGWAYAGTSARGWITGAMFLAAGLLSAVCARGLPEPAR